MLLPVNRLPQSTQDNRTVFWLPPGAASRAPRPGLLSVFQCRVTDIERGTEGHRMESFSWTWLEGLNEEGKGATLSPGACV